MGYLQPEASSCNAYWLTPNEQVSGSSPLVGFLFVDLQVKLCDLK